MMPTDGPVPTDADDEPRKHDASDEMADLAVPPAPFDAKAFLAGLPFPGRSAAIVPEAEEVIEEPRPEAVIRTTIVPPAPAPLPPARPIIEKKAPLMTRPLPSEPPAAEPEPTPPPRRAKLPALVTAAAAVLPPRRSEPVIVPEDAVPEPPNPVPANLQLLMAAAARAQARQAEPASPPRPPRMVEPEMVPAAPVMAELPPARPILPEARMRMPAPPAPPPLEEPPAIMVPRPRRLPEPMPPEPVERPILPDAGRLPTRPTDLPPATPVPAPVEPEPIVRETARPEETRREENRAEEIRGLMPPSPPEPDEEVELAWYGYAARTLLPSFLVLTAITVVVGPGAWFLEPVAWVWGHIDPLWLAAPLGAAWLLQLVRWGYRVGCYSYRLTNRRLFVSQGFLYPRRDGLDLADIARTRSSKTLMGWLLNVGRVHVELADPQSEPVILEGVSGPRRVANQLLQRAQEAREASVVSGRWTAPTR